VLNALNIQTLDDLSTFLDSRMADKRMMEAALAAGWEEEHGVKYSPGARRRWRLFLTVYQADRLPVDLWDEAHDSPTGIRFTDEGVFDFIRKRLAGTSVSDTGSSNRPTHSSHILHSHQLLIQLTSLTRVARPSRRRPLPPPRS
jgi:hypothetical protein